MDLLHSQLPLGLRPESTFADFASRCTSFSLPDLPLLPPATLQETTYHPANSHVKLSNVAYAVESEALPAFCRVSFRINTTDHSTAYSELWLPDEWYGRFLAVGNGGWAGGVNYGDLAHQGVSKHFATASTDTGHSSSIIDMAWALNSPEALIDHADRALHYTVQLSKAFITAYYSTPSSHSYYSGCSTGGRQGLISAQRYPTDFDGILVGCPASWISHLQAWSMRVNRLIQGETAIRREQWEMLSSLVIQQCADGDGIVNRPRECKPRWYEALCRPGRETGNCLSSKQVEVLEKIYGDWVDSDGTHLMSGLLPGGEMGHVYGISLLTDGAAPPIAESFYKHAIFNNSKWDPDTFDFQTALLGESINPGGMDAIDPNLEAFMNPSQHNGKIIHYVGQTDILIPPGDSIHYYESVQKFIRANTPLELEDNYRLYTLPGANHCSGGAGSHLSDPPHFGRSSSDTPPLHNSTRYDALLALVEWVEGGIAPDLLSIKYNDDQVQKGVKFERPVCKWPLQLRYKGGESEKVDSWTCA
ncbi:feruloyl esterase-like protein [Atractiella rhizophila]|nr:feruloyl esterase-like protein [Atractiella rhizophila]